MLKRTAKNKNTTLKTSIWGFIYKRSYIKDYEINYISTTKTKQQPKQNKERPNIQSICRQKTPDLQK
jgi:hypothetical protein